MSIIVETEDSVLKCSQFTSSLRQLKFKIIRVPPDFFGLGKIWDTYWFGTRKTSSIIPPDKYLFNSHSTEIFSTNEHFICMGTFV